MLILAVGTILAYAPFLVLTLAPALINAPLAYASAIGSQFTTLAFGLVPIAMGYAFLRYHLLVIDRHIHRAVTLLVGFFCLAMGGYLLFLFSGLLPPSDATGLLWGAAVIMAIFVPLVWRIAPVATKRLFNPDLSSLHRLLYEEQQSWESDLLTPPDTSSLEVVACLLMSAVGSALKAQHVCFLALQKESGTYRLISPPENEQGGTGIRDELPSHIIQALDPGARMHQNWLDASAPAFILLASAKRPLLLSEFRPRQEVTLSGRIARLFAATQAYDEPLLVPVRRRMNPQGQNELMGVLVLGAREEPIPYAGPDFAPIELLLARTSWLLDQAYVDTQTSQHVAMLKTLSSASTLLATGNVTVEELARAYANVAAASAGPGVGAEIWLFDEYEGLLLRVVQTGSGPVLPHGGVMKPRASSDWESWFYEGSSLRRATHEGHKQHNLLSLLEVPDFPFAWLPLQCGERRLGVLVLTYSSARHAFAPGEQQILEVFAHQLATVVENVQFYVDAHAASVSQLEQERLKRKGTVQSVLRLLGQLTVIQRYIDLLATSDTTLPSEILPQLRLFEEETSTPLDVYAPGIREAFTFLSSSARACLIGLDALVWPPQSTLEEGSSLEKRVQEQVNEILRNFEQERTVEVLVITPDPDYAALLASALGLEGYSPSTVSTCRQAVEWVQLYEHLRSLPAVLLLDPLALGSLSLENFAHQVQVAWPTGLPPAPLLLLREGDPAATAWQAQEDLLPLPLHDLLERLQACIRGQP